MSSSVRIIMTGGTTGGTTGGPEMLATSPATAGADADLERGKQARLRAAAVRTRLNLAGDALAAADLLLGMAASVRSVGKGQTP